MTSRTRIGRETKSNAHTNAICAQHILCSACDFYFSSIHKIAFFFLFHCWNTLVVCNRMNMRAFKNSNNRHVACFGKFKTTKPIWYSNLEYIVKHLIEFFIQKRTGAIYDSADFAEFCLIVWSWLCWCCCHRRRRFFYLCETFRIISYLLIEEFEKKCGEFMWVY